MYSRVTKQSKVKDMYTYANTQEVGTLVLLLLTQNIKEEKYREIKKIDDNT
jgi:hypothetical protein